MLEELAELTLTLANGRRDLADLNVQYNFLYFQTFLDCQESSVAARSRLAENACLTLESERQGVSANNASTADIIDLVKTILVHRWPA